MALSAAEIGEKVFIGQAAMTGVEPILGLRTDEENVPALICALMHYASAYDLDARALADQAWNQFEQDRKGPIG
jgi:hypothetical protein